MRESVNLFVFTENYGKPIIYPFLPWHGTNHRHSPPLILYYEPVLSIYLSKLKLF